jgi:hypothetical protein
MGYLITAVIALNIGFLLGAWWTGNQEREQ